MTILREALGFAAVLFAMLLSAAAVCTTIALVVVLLAYDHRIMAVAAIPFGFAVVCLVMVAAARLIDRAVS